jgi:hypothetical protein
MFANYEQERHAFRTLLQPDCEKRIVFFAGASGMGKSNLLMSCGANLPQNVIQIPIGFKGSITGISEVFSRTVRYLGLKLPLSNFRNKIGELTGINPSISLEEIEQAGNNNHITIALHADNSHEREERQVYLTDALFQDIEKYQYLCLWVMDTFEQATTEVSDWVAARFLERVAFSTQARVVLAGQKIPEKSIDWHHCCDMYELYGVKEARHWLPVIESLGKRVPVEPAEIWLGGICHALKGNPKEIMSMIKDFPNR